MATFKGLRKAIHDGRRVETKPPEPATAKSSRDVADAQAAEGLGTACTRIEEGVVAAFGNSDGDLQMLQWIAAGEGPRFCLLVHHTDADREWAYARESTIGRLDKAHEKAWTVVDMRKD